MTIRTRIFKSNTWIVLLSLFALLLIGGTVIFIFEDTYVKTFVGGAELQENSYDVQTQINQFNITNGTSAANNYSQLKKLLDKYDYQLYMTDGTKKSYSSLHRSQREFIHIIEPQLSYTSKSSVYIWENQTIIAKKLTGGTSEYNIIAIHSDALSGIFKLHRGTFELLLISFLIVGTCSILVIMLISRIFTQRLVNQIMVPIRKLIDGAKRIEQGSLDVPITYKGEVEFETVCSSFNKMQETLKENLEKNAAYEKARTDLISGVSHDLRTPLTSVKGYIKGIKDGVANTPQKQEKYLDIAYKKACDMDMLLHKLFYFSKLETGSMPIFPAKISLLQFLEEIIRENSEYYKENNLEVTLSPDEGGHYVTIDKEQMSRVIANIIENSIKYRIRDKVNVTIEITSNGDNELLSVTDDGEGVPEDKLPHLFEQFYRADDARSSKKGGSGLGLYIAKHIVELHGGRISARNRGGLSIEITLPKSEE